MSKNNIIKKRSITINGHDTSVSLENIFWEELEKIAKEKKITKKQIIEKIDNEKTANLSSSIRVWVTEQLLKKIDKKSKN